MADPIHYRLSNSSDDSPLQEDPSDSEHDTIPLDEEVEEAIQTLDPRNSQLSLHSGAGHSLDDRRRHRRSLTHRDFFKSLVEEGGETKQLRKLLRAALERLDGETRRAQEAERRALELAQRFKIVNEARVSAQQEVERVHSELRMYKVQLDNAQREILRGSDLLKDLESQRDSAEASAARARSTARRLKEEQLMTRAREEGRKEGYQEGLKRGYQQARGPGLDGQGFEVPPAGFPPLSSIVGDPSRAEDRTEPLDGFSMMNLSTPPHASVPLMSSLGGHDPLDDDDGQYGAGAQGSRFREMMTPSTLHSAPLDSASQAGGGWPASNAPEEAVRYIRPTLARNPPPASQHPNYSKPPDGYIPPMGADHLIAMPPPHELHDQPSMSSIHLGSATATDELVAAPPVNPRDYAYPHRPRGSPRSFADSLPSTTISQFELVSSPKTATRGLRERSSGLSAIPEVSSSMEFSPGTDSRVRSSILPDPFTFPGPDDRIPVDGPGNEIPRPRSREASQRMADELRYSDPELVEQWRRSTASPSHPSSSRERLHTPHRPARVTTPSPLSGPSITGTPSPANPSPSHRRSRSVQSPPSDGRPYLGAGSSSGAHRRTASSTPISIRIEPPSGPGSNLSPASYQDDMLSPEISSRPTLPPVSPATPTPDRPHSRGQPGSNPQYGYGLPNPPAQSPYYGMPTQSSSSPRHTPDPTRGYPSYPYNPAPSPLGEQGRPSSRTGSADFGRSVGSDYSSRPRTPTGRPTSAMAGDYPAPARTPTRSTTPGHASASYAMPSQSVPSVLRSPSRASSRQSLQPEPMRPSSRASADQHRILSMHAGSTPAMVQRPLSGSQIRRVPSAGSINSETSRKSGMYQPFDSTSYVDPAALASTEDLTSMQSPNTMANTKANSAWMGPGPSRLRASSPSMSYASLRS